MSIHIANKRIILLGANGDLGSRILSAQSRHQDVFSTCTVPWLEFDNIENLGLLRQTLQRKAGCLEGQTIVFANGLTDPAISERKLLFSNVEFPIAIIQATRGIPSIRYLTFGTILERFPSLVQQNAYLRSKFQLSDRIRKLYETMADRVLHIQLHTLYGSRPKKHMFLGQLFQALLDRQRFPMSRGLQLREYHHIDDVGENIVSIILSDWSALFPGCFSTDLSSGESIRLVDLARELFREFSDESKLLVGKYSTPIGENFNVTFQCSPTGIRMQTRPAISGIVDTFRELLRQ